ncbi:MAG: glycosyltransferase family 39 protein [Chloroflexi bacterium]|nr:glycosyltransferase family 39 protein [Chloroflexota bacterium]MBU1747609.1 glycosyltransferase family 39 protein [Chloroflexota bacterium]MBU1877944.1 glycosyltransferase family 39 protein [Chloroflexota bacterium]
MKYRLLLLLVILLALALRAGGLGAWSVTHDDAYGLWVATQPLSDVLPAIVRDVHPPLYYLLLHGWLALGPHSDMWARLPSVLAGAALVPVMYALGRWLWDRRTGLAAALLATLSSLAVAQAREARMYPLVVLLLALAAYALLRATRERRARWWVAYVILAVLALYAHYYAALVLIAFAFYVLRITWSRSRNTLYALGSTLAITIFLMPWLPALLDQIGRVRAGFWIPPPSLAAVGRVAQTLAFYAVTPRPATATPADFAVKVVGAGCVVALLAVLVAGSRRLAGGGYGRPVWLPVLWLIVPVALAYAVSLAGPSVFEPRYFAVCLPAFWLLVARGVTALPGRALRSVVLAGLVLASLASLVILFTYPAYRPPDTRAAAAWLWERTDPGDLVVHASQFSLRPVVWYNGDGNAGVLVDDPALPAQLAAASNVRLVVPYDVRVADGPRQADAIAAECAAQHGLWDLRTVARFWGVHIYSYDR